MIFQRYSDLFEICSPIFWPWLWLQLAILCAQKAEDGRERLIMVSWWGKVYVLAVGSDPDALEAERHLRKQTGRFETRLSPLLSAKFPGDTPALTERADAVPLLPRPIQITARSITAARPLLQDKTHALAPG
ncbi:MAG: hypothetical protein AAGH90_02250 [Pseudomonadota bacterium]